MTIINEAAKDGYFGWLYDLVEPRSRHTKTHFALLSQLHTKPFRWFVRNDENRDEDGKALREEFLDIHNMDGDDLWLDQPASILEMLIALSRRLEFDTYGDAVDWFWKLLANLELDNYTDSIHYQWEQEIDEVLENLLNRTYGREGGGGLFPLRKARRDQRRVEIWYQRSAYLLEGNDVASG